MRTALVTGSAGFIGAHLCQRLLSDGYRVVGVDALTDYYDVELKRRRLEQLCNSDKFEAVEGHVETPGLLYSLFGRERPSIVIHLAAQAGVRYSIENPRSYLESNVVGTFEILEAARAYVPKHLLIASTSSAFGANTDMPYREIDKADHQMSFYAATKKATEVMAHSYSHLYNIPMTVFRFFTVYGPWGRPDMALFKFAKAIFEGQPIDVYNNGDMKRDFTYIDDLVQAIALLIEVPPAHTSGEDRFLPIDSISPVAPWRIVNIGNSETVALSDFIEAIEQAIGSNAAKNFLPMQPGDVPATWADASLLESLTGYSPTTNVKEGVGKFIEWYKSYYRIGES